MSDFSAYATNDTNNKQWLKRQRVKAALANLFVGDALSMPVHWFYNPGDILRAFGPHGIDGLHAAPSHHPSSIMSLHSTSHGGRSKRTGQDQIIGKSVIGDVILKGRKHLWNQTNVHYHHGMLAGENTLNAWCAHELITLLCELQALPQPQVYSTQIWADRYINFMTAEPPAHPDTYAESYHRGFFANWLAGNAPTECGAVTHDTPSMGALVTLAPLALALLPTHSIEQTCDICRDHIQLTHPDAQLMKVVNAYVQLMHALLEHSDPQTIVTLLGDAAAVIAGTNLLELLQHNRGDAHIVGRTYSLACYITDSWPSVCYLAARYHASVKQALLTNTNLGGENAHRGSVLGTLLGLSCATIANPWYEQLALNPQLDDLLERYLNQFYPL